MEGTVGSVLVLGRASREDVEVYSFGMEQADVLAVAEQRARPIDVLGHSYGAVCALGPPALGAPLRRLVPYEPPGMRTVPADWLNRV